MTRALHVTTVVAALASASTLSAHHSPSLFDQGTDVTLTGVVTTYQWRSPLRIPWEHEGIRKALREEIPDQPRGGRAN